MSPQENIESLIKKAHFLEVINSFAQQLFIAKTVDEIVWTVAKQAIAKLDYVDCIVYLWDEDENCLVQKAAHGPKNPTEFDINDPIKLQLGEGICGSVAITGIPEIIKDTSKDPRYRIDDESRQSEITIPILLNGQVIGIIDSEHPEKNFYTEVDLEILTTIASMVAVKIDQAKTQENLKKLVEVKTAALSENLDKLQISYEEIKRSNREKETLLKEIHHRVKNNLQVISSLLNLQASQTDNDAVKEVFLDARNRIISMSAIHEQIYQKGNLAAINSKEYIEEITRELIVTYKITERVRINHDLEKVSLDLEKSVPLGLIINELVSNSMKHGFPGDKTGTISITLSKESGTTEITIADDGIGFDMSRDRHTLGLDLVETLVSQLDGTLEVASGTEEGTQWSVRFPSV